MSLATQLDKGQLDKDINAPGNTQNTEELVYDLTREDDLPVFAPIPDSLDPFETDDDDDDEKEKRRTKRKLFDDLLEEEEEKNKKDEKDNDVKQIEKKVKQEQETNNKDKDKDFDVVVDKCIVLQTILEFFLVIPSRDIRLKDKLEDQVRELPSKFPDCIHFIAFNAAKYKVLTLIDLLLLKAEQEGDLTILHTLLQGLQQVQKEEKKQKEDRERDAYMSISCQDITEDYNSRQLVEFVSNKLKELEKKEEKENIVIDEEENFVLPPIE